jgi:2-oxoisovalerate dehydrogenase E1 component alpha subunit
VIVIQNQFNKSNSKKGAIKSSSKNSNKSSAKKSSKNIEDFGGLSESLVKDMFSIMLKSRVLEERLIKIYKAGEAFFWIGAPGEEAWGVPLGLLVNKGHGIKHDYLHLHYRATPTVMAMGMPMIDSIRLIMNKVTDPHTGGRNFSNHYCIPKWNVTPITSPIEVQYNFAIGTGLAQSKDPKSGISIITGGDAGTAESDFASCLIWANRPERPLPLLITVQNNRWGISTAYEGQHGEKNIADRGLAFGMRTRVINGNDPIETYLALQEEMEYIRKERKPVLLEAKVSRLYGHSSASGANLDESELDCLKAFEVRVKSAGLFTDAEISVLRQGYETEAREAMEIARKEAFPSTESIWDHTYAQNENADWRNF